MNKKNRSKELYIQMFSIHGLLRSHNLELGRDADTGGQILYVLELAKQLSKMEKVKKIDLFTRRISDKTVSADYGQEIEKVNEKLRIIRIRCGGEKYLRKELLWPHLDEFIDRTLQFIKKEKNIPDIFHGHYADAGYVANSLSRYFGKPFVFTGHSLGHSKLRRLVDNGMTKEEINKKFKIERRIEAEEENLKNAQLVITSTNHEITKQYGQYDNKENPFYSVIAPGFNLEKFYPYYHQPTGDNSENERQMYARSNVLEEMQRFLVNDEKPLILTLCRPDKRKNISGLIKAYGQDKELQAIANLAIFAGLRKNIDSMEDNERSVLTEMLLLMDRYDLYGKMAIPKTHDFDYEVPEIYRLAAKLKGVFVNVALTEPFGLTLIEAAASGLPIVATNDGGPHDIIGNLHNGMLVPPTDTKEIAEAMKDILVDPQKWKTFSKNGVFNVLDHYTWEAHSKKYLAALDEIPDSNTGRAEISPHLFIGARLTGLDHFLITDIDNTLIGENNENLETLLHLLAENKENIGFGVATGRTIDSAVTQLKKYGVTTPDIIISSVGTEIYYGSTLFFDRGWATHIAKNWDREKIKTLLDNFDFLTYQEEENQGKFKVSYNMEANYDRLSDIHNILTKEKCKYNLIYSSDKHLDIVPFRASKGKALRYLSYKWGIPLDHFMVCGDSGNDEGMLRGDTLGVVVGNYQQELGKLKKLRNVYFAKEQNSGGIIQGLNHYNFISKAKSEKEE